jgi:hypothetical protein
MSFSLASQPSAAPTKSGRIAIMQELPQAAKRCRRCIQILSLVHKYLADGDWFKPFAAFGSSYEIGAYRDHVGAAAGCETVQLNYTDTQLREQAFLERKFWPLLRNGGEEDAGAIQGTSFA